MVHGAHAGERLGAGWRNNGTTGKAHPLHPLSCCLWITSPQLLIAPTIGDVIVVKITESLVTLKGWNLVGRKFVKKLRGVVDLAKAEVGRYEEHADLSLAVLSCSEGLEDTLELLPPYPPVFRL